MSDLAEKLKYFRKKANLTQQQVADALGIDRSAYSYYETDTSTPKLATVQNLARFYNTSVDLLLGNNHTVGDGEVLESPDSFEKWYTKDGFNLLSDFEQGIILRIRLMNTDERKKLIEYIDKSIKNG